MTRRFAGPNRYEDTTDSDVVVVTSGIARKPGMSRSELLETNTNIVRSVVREVATRSPGAVSGHRGQSVGRHDVRGLPGERIPQAARRGYGPGFWTPPRFCTFIAQELNVSVHNVHAMVLGGHGDAMVPLIRYTTVAGRPVDQWMSKERLDALVKRTRGGRRGNRQSPQDGERVLRTRGLPWSKWWRRLSVMNTRCCPVPRCVTASTA